MIGLRAFLNTNRKLLALFAFAFTALSTLLLYKLGSLVGGLSTGEIVASTQVVGWRGIFVDPLYLPLKIIRSVVFFVFADHGQTLTRLPNIIIGAVAVISFTGLMKLWLGTRTAVLGSVLFATSAWTLHTSRLAIFDVLYLCAIPVLLLTQVLLQRYYTQRWLVIVCVIAWSLLIYVPGLVWLVLVSLVFQRKTLRMLWAHHQSALTRILIILAGIISLQLLVYRLATDLVMFRTWLGLPSEFGSASEIVKQFVAVPVHLFIRGPQYPDIWLAQSPIFDVFVIVMTVIGVYFYAKHWRSSRSRILAVFALMSSILVGLGGAVGLSLVIPIVFIAAVTGLTYLLHEWLKVFPKNPLARSIGIGLITIAVVCSAAFNLRSYFVAWPNNSETKATFQYRL